MKKVVRALQILLYAVVLYSMTFIFVASFTLTAEAFTSWKKSEMVTVNPEHIEISGNKMLSKKEIQLISGVENRKSWFDIDEKKMETLLLSSGWVKKAFVKKIFPDSVKIVIEEFIPAIVVNSKKLPGLNEDRKNAFTLWFADDEGIVFKRAFPGETTASLPFFHLAYDSLSEKLRGSRIKTAVNISKAWKEEPSICEIRSIRYDFTAGFSADCEAPDSMTTYIAFGTDFLDEEISVMKDKFADISSGLLKENKWAGEYIFEKTEKEGKIRVIVGKVFKNVNRGSDA
jgi:hypothetical protein